MITRAKLNVFFGHHKELQKFEDGLSDALKLAKSEDNLERQVRYEDTEKIKGKPTKVWKTVKEKALWEVVRFGGLDTVEAKKLKELYPEVFEFTVKSALKVKELRMFEQSTFGFTFKNMTSNNVVKLNQGLIKYYLWPALGVVLGISLAFQVVLNLL